VQVVQRGEITIIRRLLNKRFGKLATWIEERPANLSTPELEDLSVRLFDAMCIRATPWRTRQEFRFAPDPA
jgi:hypothetical protein